MSQIPENLLLRDLAVVMIVAAVVTLLFHRLRQPVVLGYILAGVIIGPHTPPFPLIQDEASINTLAELGVVLLMFSLGLEFSLRKLKAVGSTAFIAAALEILLMLWVGYQVGRWFGWSKMDSVFLGAILSISSTTIIVKALSDLGKSKAPFAELIYGILIVEDILAIAMIALLSSIAMTGALAWREVAGTVGRLGIFLTAALVLGLISVPPLLRHVAKYRSDEMLLITVLGLCFGVALLAVTLGYSVALGAFVIGTIIGEARQIGKIKLLTEPVRDMFSAVFFVAMGMLIDPRLLEQSALPILIVTVAVVVGKVLTCAFGTFVAGHDARTALRVGMGLAQIGEFSFIIAALGLTLKVTSEFLYPIAVSVSAITALLTPYLIRSSDPLVNWFDRVAPPAVVNYLQLYSRWLDNLRRGRRRSEARRLARKWTWQILLNGVLLTGVFTAAAYAAERAARWWPQIPGWLGGAQGLVWLVAVLAGLPVVIAILRKLQAFGLLVAEMSLTESAAGRDMTAVRSLLANTIWLAGAVGLGLWVLLISAAFLPQWPALLVLVAIVVVIGAGFWRFFIQIHAKAQVALRETLASAEAPHAPAAEEPLPVLLKGAQLEMIEISAGSAGAGKLIRELELRRKTGASIVGIERTGATIINPGPDEELQSADKVFLLGQPAQLKAARALLTAPNPSEDRSPG